MSASIVAISIVLFIFVGIPAICGYFYFGATQTTYSLTVEKLWVDNSGSESHYMVRGHDQKIIEINKPWFDWNPQHSADLIYSDLNTNGTYNFKCYGWENYGLHWYHICYERVA